MFYQMLSLFSLLWKEVPEIICNTDLKSYVILTWARRYQFFLVTGQRFYHRLARNYSMKPNYTKPIIHIEKITFSIMANLNSARLMANYSNVHAEYSIALVYFC